MSTRKTNELAPGQIVTRAEREQAVGEWLLAAASDLKEACTGWAGMGIAALVCGGIFTAVRVPASVVYAAAGTSGPSDVAAYLADALHGGPVIVGAQGRHYYAMVPPSAALRRLPPGTECLSRGTLFGVPRPDFTEPERHSRSSYWAVPMDGPGALCSPDALSQLVAHGRYRHALGERAAEAEKTGGLLVVTDHDRPGRELEK